MKKLNALVVAHDYLREYVKEGAVCIDATAGRGRDTAFLAELVGETGTVTSFDIQEEALISTAELTKERGFTDRTRLILDNHSNIEQYFKPSTIDAVTFNLGWLPGGDHTVHTLADSSIQAVEAAMRLIKVGGIITICVYYGRDCGFEEKDRLLEYLPTVNHKAYNVVVTQFINYPNDPPFPVLIRREQ